MIQNILLFFINTFVTTGNIQYIYNANGVKVRKIVTEGTSVQTTDYLSGFQYINNILEFFPHAEGYVKATKTSYNYVYNYTDHLGNIRLSYTKDPTTNVLTILEENNYYPFGLKHRNYNMTKKSYEKLESTGGIVITPTVQKVYDYKYNGKEWQDELGLNFYDYGARNYDPAIGRWMNVDPLAEQGRRWTPYNYAFSNPLYFVDPDGMWPKLPTWNSVKQYYSGMATGAKQTLAKTYNAVSNPVATVKSMLAPSSSKQTGADALTGMITGGGMTKDIVSTVIKSTSKALEGDYFGAGQVNGEKLTEKVIEGALVGATVGTGRLLSGMSKASTVTNPVPTTLARVIPADLEATTLGAQSSSDVFVTAASDISGLNAPQIANKLTIPQSASGFKVIEFPTPASGIASPINRTNPGFVGKGQTAGGAREFTIPNQPIPANSTINIVQ